MAATDLPVVLEGVITAEGTLELRERPNLPPGPVRVTVEPAATPRSRTEFLPDPPWLDESIPAPFDLPLAGPAQRIEARPIRELLPEPFATPSA